MAKGYLRNPRRAVCAECGQFFEARGITQMMCSSSCTKDRKVRMTKARGKGQCADCGGPKAGFYATRCWSCSKKVRARPMCSVDACERPHCANGLCRFHRDRTRRGISFAAPVRGTSGYRRGETTCSVDGCERLTFSGRTGHCAMHHERYRDTGDVGPVAPRRRPAGTWIPWQVDRFGYVRRRENGKWITQHRAVMEQVIGRPLLRHESVHHKNGQRDDNRPENLELWSKSQPAGQRVTDKVAWALELLALYAPETLADRPVQLRLVV